jgi:hypothetical protein
MYAYDVWVNWSIDASADGTFSVPEYFEWRKSDNIRVMDKMPVVKVSKELFTSLKLFNQEIPNEILIATYNKAYSNESGYKRQYLHAFIMTDGERVMAIDTDDTLDTVFRTALIPRQELGIISQMKDFDALEVNWSPPQFEKEAEFPVTLSNIGLTRAEKQLKHVLLEAINLLALEDNIDKIRYWYSGLFQGTSTDSLTTEGMIADIRVLLRNGWNAQFYDFGKSLIRTLPDYIKQEWDGIKWGNNRDKIGN